MSSDPPLAYNGSAVESFNSSVNENTSNMTAFIHGCRVVDRKFEYLPWDNPDSIISLNTQVTAYKVAGVLIPLLGTLGIPLNIINCIVYFKLGLHERVNLLLFSLGCADFLVTSYLFVYFVEYFYMLLIGSFKMDSTVLKVAVNEGLTVVPIAANYLSGFISTLIACERCLCIVSPFKAKQILQTKVTAVILLVSAATIAGLNYVIAIKYKMGCQYIVSLKMSLTVFYAGEFYIQNKQFVDILNVVIFGLFLPSVFVLTAAIATSITVVKLKGVAQWRQTTASVTMESKEIALTKMLVAVSILFITCAVPNLILKVIPLFMKGFQIGGRNQNAIMLAIVVTHSFNAINSTFNFLFYFKMGSRFRNTLKGMCGCSQNAQGITDKTTNRS